LSVPADADSRLCTAPGSGAAVAEPLLAAADLVKYYPVSGFGFARRRSVHAVDGVTFNLRRGETLAIVGESGCGKSTLGRLAAALEEPTGGRMFYRGAPVDRMSRLDLKRFRRAVQVVFQDPYSSLDPRMSALRTIIEPMRTVRNGRSTAQLRAASLSLLERVGLSVRHADRLPHQFSGGQRQRIGIARALAAEPSAIVCDEPVSALDVSVQAQILNLLQDLQADLGVSYLFVSHDLSVVQHMSDRVAVMYLGRIVEQGSQEQVMNEALHPYTHALLSALPPVHRANRPPRERIRLTGEVPSAVSPPSGCRFRTRCWKAQEVCSTVSPTLVADAAGHEVACHFPEPGNALTAP
jgi:oligopeptide/dipeptide ABC transporter ATP-binding protein